MNDIAAFLAKRLADQYWTAMAADRTDLWRDPNWLRSLGVASIPEEHILCHSPTAVLADIAAKRAILDDYTTTCRIRDQAAERIRSTWPNPTSEDLDEWTRAQREASLLDGVVRQLASAHATHPDYAESIGVS